MGKFRDRAARATYIAVFWGIALFGVSFRLEGWDVGDISNLFNHPVGVGSLVLIVVCVVLFVVNLRSRELPPDEKVRKRDSRRPVLRGLKGKVKAYMRKSYLIYRSPDLYEPREYGLDSESSLIRVMVKLSKLSESNNKYLELKNKKVDSLREVIDETVAQLRNNRLEKLVYKIFQDEHKARSQRIAIRMYRTCYQHTDKSDARLLQSESRLLKPNHVKKFGETLRKLYDHIEFMEKGGDIWEL